MSAAVLASLHYLALAIGFGALVVRGRLLRQTSISSDPKLLFTADNLWGIASLLWLGTGLLRAFAGFEKGTEFYLSSPLFWVKMALFAVIGGLEIKPMIHLIKWRIAIRKDRPAPKTDFTTLAKINHMQIVLVVVIIFVASAMARGIGR